MEERGLSIAYVNYGPFSGVTGNVANALRARGHAVTPVQATGPLEWRDGNGRRRFTYRVALHLALSALRFGRRAVAHRWNTTFAFDVHSRRAEEVLNALPVPVDVVLQNGALFSPGLPPSRDYALLLDHTRQLSMERPAAPEAGLPAPADYGPGWRTREEAVYRGARAITTFSRRVAESLQRDYGVPGERIHVVGAGANVLPKEFSRADDGRTVVFVGKDFRRKGGPVLLRAFRRLRERFPDAKLLIAGPTEKLDLPPGAEQLGLVPFEKLPALFARSTVFAMPTLREPFGIAFLDAMACGLPCVGTAVEAVPEIVQHHETGLLVPTGDDAALADALAALLADRSRARTMGIIGRARVESWFTWELVAERLEKALVSRPPAKSERERTPHVA